MLSQNLIVNSLLKLPLKIGLQCQKERPEEYPCLVHYYNRNEKYPLNIHIHYKEHSLAEVGVSELIKESLSHAKVMQDSLFILVIKLTRISVFT